MHLYYNGTVPAINTSTVATSALRSIHCRSKNRDLEFTIKESTVQTISPTQRLVVFVSKEYATLAALAYHPTLAFSPLSFSINNGPYTPIVFECLAS
jgi:hypothetical protein